MVPPLVPGTLTRASNFAIRRMSLQIIRTGHLHLIDSLRKPAYVSLDELSQVGAKGLSHEGDLRKADLTKSC